MPAMFLSKSVKHLETDIQGSAGIQWKVHTKIIKVDQFVKRSNRKQTERRQNSGIIGLHCFLRKFK
jgi:hypothetical protein